MDHQKIMNTINIFKLSKINNNYNILFENTLNVKYICKYKFANK